MVKKILKTALSIIVGIVIIILVVVSIRFATEYFNEEEIVSEFAERTEIMKNEIYRVLNSSYYINTTSIHERQFGKEEGNITLGEAMIEIYYDSTMLTRVRLTEGSNTAIPYHLKVVLHRVSSCSIEVSTYLLYKKPSRAQSFIDSII